MTEIIDHGKWTPYIPVPWPDDKPRNVIFCKRESDGVDWYEFIYTMEEPKKPVRTDESGMPIYEGHHVPRKILRENFTLPYVRCAAFYQPTFDAYIIGPAVYNVTKVFPSGGYAFEITDYTGSDPQGDFGGKAYNPLTGVISDPIPKIYTLTRSTIVERINTACKFAQLREYLNTHPLESELWYGTTQVEPTNATMLTILKAIGADPKAILAPMAWERPTPPPSDTPDDIATATAVTPTNVTSTPLPPQPPSTDTLQ